MSSVSYVHLRSGQQPPEKSPAPFKAMLIVDDAVADDWRALVCNWLVRSGCLYCVCWGLACEDWHDEVDRANLQTWTPEDRSDEKLVMTTWHDDEPLSEAMWFAASCADHPTVALHDVVILHIGPESREASILREYNLAAAVGLDG